MTKVTEEYLAEREQLHKNATEGPWISPDGYCVRKKLLKDSDSTDDSETLGDWKPVCLVWKCADKSVEQGIGDMEFIADAHKSMPVLIAEVRRLHDLLHEIAQTRAEYNHRGVHWLTVLIGTDNWEALQEFK